ncbi:MAG TPA: helix-turn-helix domain-containing protein [Polyangiaceae bacterium]|nr:helix-turn-helix domain-containing protein [Polyangiaceae bacterium]
MEREDELDRTEVAKLFGVGTEMVRNLQRDGQLKPIGKRGGRVVYRRADIEALAQKRSEQKQAASARREAARAGLDVAVELEFTRYLQHQAQRDEQEAERARKDEEAQQRHDTLRRQLESMQRELRESKRRPMAPSVDLTDSVLPLAVLAAMAWLAKDQRTQQEPPTPPENAPKWQADAVFERMYAQLTHNDKDGK